MIVNRGLSVGDFIYLTMLLLPNFLAIILPIALFTIVVFTYSKMITDRELVVMRAAGLSQVALAKPALILAVGVMLLSYALHLFLLPESYRIFRELQWEIRYNYSAVLLKEGLFNQVTEDITVYVRERASDGQLHGILVHDKRKDGEPFTIMAERGAMVEQDGKPRVVMFEGNRQEIDPETGKMSVLYFDRYVFDLSSTRSEPVVRYREPRERTMEELIHLDLDTVLNKQDYGKFVVELHKRLAAPLSVVGFTLIALACLISGSFTRRGQGRRVLAAVGIMVVLQGIALGIENMAAKRLELIPLIYILNLLPIVAGFWVTIRPPRLRVKPAPISAEAA
jgi:lipopolysaccharide export system permease protein